MTRVFREKWIRVSPICRHPRATKRLFRMEPCFKAEGDYPYALMCFRCGETWILDAHDKRLRGLK